MIADTSALVAIIAREPGYEWLTAHMEAAELMGVGAPTLLEAAMVLTSKIGTSAPD